MAILGSKKKLAALNKENCGEQPNSNMAQNSNVSGPQEDYITQNSEEIEGIATKKSSQDLIWKENPHFRRAMPSWRLSHELANSGLLRRRPRTHMAQTGEPMRTNPRLILLLKQASFRARLHTTLAQNMATTWWQEFTRKSHTASLVQLQECRKRTALLVNRISAVKIPLRRLKQTKSYWPFSNWQITTILQNFIKLST